MSIMKKAANEVTASMSGALAAAISVYAAGKVGVSAVGLSTGLATLGLGSMFLGVGVVALIGIGTYATIKHVMEAAE